MTVSEIAKTTGVAPEEASVAAVIPVPDTLTNSWTAPVACEAFTRMFVTVTVEVPDGIVRPENIMVVPVRIPETVPEELIASASVPPVTAFSNLLVIGIPPAMSIERLATPPLPVQVNVRSPSCSARP